MSLDPYYDMVYEKAVELMNSRLHDLDVRRRAWTSVCLFDKVLCEKVIGVFKRGDVDSFEKRLVDEYKLFETNWKKEKIINEDTIDTYRRYTVPFSFQIFRQDVQDVLEERAQAAKESAEKILVEKPVATQQAVLPNPLQHTRLNITEDKQPKNKSNPPKSVTKLPAVTKTDYSSKETHTAHIKKTNSERNCSNLPIEKITIENQKAGYTPNENKDVSGKKNHNSGSESGSVASKAIIVEKIAAEIKDTSTSQKTEEKRIRHEKRSEHVLENISEMNEVEAQSQPVQMISHARKVGFEDKVGSISVKSPKNVTTDCKIVVSEEPEKVNDFAGNTVTPENKTAPKTGYIIDVSGGPAPFRKNISLPTEWKQVLDTKSKCSENILKRAKEMQDLEKYLETGILREVNGERSSSQNIVKKKTLKERKREALRKKQKAAKELMEERKIKEKEEDELLENVAKNRNAERANFLAETLEERTDLWYFLNHVARWMSEGEYCAEDVEDLARVFLYDRIEETSEDLVQYQVAEEYQKLLQEETLILPHQECLAFLHIIKDEDGFDEYEATFIENFLF